jgi:hypothetical protein
MGANADAIPAYMGVILTLLFPAVIVIVLYYAEPGFPWHSYVTLVLGFYAAFAILLLVPIDIAIVQSDRSSTTIGHDSQYDSDVNTLSIAYDTFFTMVLILGSFILAFEEYYNTDGLFCSYLGCIHSLMFDFPRLFYFGREVCIVFQAHVYRYSRPHGSGMYYLSYPYWPKSRICGC